MQDIYDTHVDDNNEAYIKLSQYQLKSTPINKIVPSVLNPSFARGNTCILKWKDHYLLNIRNVNYRIDKQGGWYHANPDRSIDTINEFVVLDPITLTCKHQHIFQTPPQKSLYRGLEDIRVIDCNNQLYYSASSQNEKDGAIQISTTFYTINLQCLPVKLIDSPIHSPVEKNWAMFVHDKQLKYVYQWYPFRVATVCGNKLNFELEKLYTPTFFRFIKNSSCGVWDVKNNHLWFLVHFHSANDRFRTYYHAIIILDGSNLEVIKISKCFTFDGQKIEYCLGFVLEAKKLCFTYTTFDTNPHVLEIPRDFMESLLSPYII